jgi:histidinol-phosphate aminotransferase
MTYQRPPDRGPGLRLHLNENTAGCSPAVLEALRTLEREDLAFYPDYGPITAQCERWLDVPAGWVQLTNGLDEGLQLVALQARLASGSDDTFEAIVVEPAFEMYRAMVEAAGGRVVRVPPRADFQFPTDAVTAAITPQTRAIYVTNPNNPTGVAIPDGINERLAARAPHALVLVDEAYADFSGRTDIGPPLERRRNLVVGRTFAKAHGLAAVRAGALVAHPDTLDRFRRLQPPYSLNVCAIRALAAALEDRDYLEWYVAESRRSKDLIYACCQRLGLVFWRSEANFVLLRAGSAAGAVVDALASRGVYVRDRSDQPGCDGCIRITAGVVEHTVRALSILEDVLASIGR